MESIKFSVGCLRWILNRHLWVLGCWSQGMSVELSSQTLCATSGSSAFIPGLLWPGVLVGFPALWFHVLQATGLNPWLLPSRSLFYFLGVLLIPNFAWVYHWVTVTCHWIQELLLASPSADPALCRSTRLGNQTIQRSWFVGRHIPSTEEWELWTCQAVLHHFGFNLLLQIVET